MEITRQKWHDQGAAQRLPVRAVLERPLPRRRRVEEEFVLSSNDLSRVDAASRDAFLSRCVVLRLNEIPQSERISFSVCPCCRKKKTDTFLGDPRPSRSDLQKEIDRLRSMLSERD